MPEELLQWLGADGMCDAGGCPNEADWMVAAARTRWERRQGFPPMGWFFCDVHVGRVPMATWEEILFAADFHDDPDYPSAGRVEAWRFLVACWPLPLRVNYEAKTGRRKP